MNDDLQRQLRDEVFTSVLEQIADAVVITDSAGSILYVNESFELMTGFKKQEVLGKKPSIVKSGVHGKSLYRELWQTLHAGYPFRQVFVNRRKGGTLYHEAKTITPVRDHNGRISHFVSTGRDVSDQMSAEARLHRLAYTDPVTDLSNRTRLQEAIEEALAGREHTGGVGLLFIDLDGFKEINDAFGHLTGDQLLFDVGHRLQKLVEAPDMVARMGGDEFAMLVRGANAIERSEHYAQTIIQSFQEEFLIDSDPVYVNASIGIAVAPTDGQDRFSLQKHADTAMYRAKKKGACARRYQADMSVVASRKFNMRNELKRASHRGEFSLVYQPQMHLVSGSVRAMEALLRWDHPSLGNVSPAEFIPALEEIGSIHATGRWVLNEACHQLRSWWASRVPIPKVAVNVSARQLADRGFLRDIEMILTNHEVPPSAVELEIVETARLAEDGATLSVLEGLRHLGVSIALDDFGTGFSSLSHVSRLPVNAVKIDREFVRAMSADGGREFIAGLIEFVGSLGLEIVAEGVEHAYQLRVLHDLGCESVQGFYVHRPAEPAVAARFAKRVAAAWANGGEQHFLSDDLAI